MFDTDGDGPLTSGDFDAMVQVAGYSDSSTEEIFTRLAERHRESTMANAPVPRGTGALVRFRSSDVLTQFCDALVAGLPGVAGWYFHATLVFDGISHN
ncbi:hypothetical protein F4553_007600 [Allocatelliglobosispora scoriae]|uniref:EF-hand domain-containing protein n=1 Tax=Allocatelliglobosispora scoriae TaxID=643052 RepID=A0A841C2P0_9ACTN|nr:hypothetical protein [Allocatelliglobosispora scoriae]MBB5874166.1 hypothetical protein [Allocatelliglobosispora scoriae]